MYVHIELLALQSWYANNFYIGMHKYGNDILLLNITKVKWVVFVRYVTCTYVCMYM